MKRKILSVVMFLVILFSATSVKAAQMELRKYGEAATIEFELYDILGVDLHEAGLAAADVEVQTDGGDFAQSDNVSATEDGTFSLVVSSAEMTGKRILVKIQDAATKDYMDKVIIIESFGHPSAQFPPQPTTEIISDPITLSTLGVKVQEVVDANTAVQYIGTPANIDGGGATLAGNLKKLADDNAGATYDATNDSLNKIATTGATAAKLTAYIQLLARSDAAIATDNSTELTEINADGGSGVGDYDNTTDAQEALAAASAPSAATIAAEVWNSLYANFKTSGTFGWLVNLIQDLSF